MRCGKPKCRPEVQGNMLCETLSQHSHVIPTLIPKYFPSEFDKSSPVIWLPTDSRFIKETLESQKEPKEKIDAIIEHHANGMAKAVCVGIWERCAGQVVPLILKK
jgi:hypothetical protein